MKVIGFSGKARHGKTTAAQLIKPLLEEKGLKAEIIPLAKRMKEQAKMLGWDGSKDERGRRLLQEISWPVKHYFGIDIYAKWCYEQAVEQNLDVLLIDDVRMMAEIDYFNSLANKGEIESFDLVRIERPGFVSDLNAQALADVSETELDTYSFDYVIVNDGTLDELKEKLVKELAL